MSSRVILPEDRRPTEPVNWRLVDAAPKENEKSAAAWERDFAERLAQFQQQSEQKVREARAAGVREGETAGRARAAAELQPAIERLSRTIEELGRLRAQMRKEAEADMVKLSLAIARRVLQRELAVDPEALHGLVLAALEKLEGQEVCRVKVHPSHAAMVAACLRNSASGSAIEVISDPTREPGAVIFETARGNLDASTESQFQEIERGLTDRLRKHS